MSCCFHAVVVLGCVCGDVVGVTVGVGVNDAVVDIVGTGVTSYGVAVCASYVFFFFVLLFVLLLTRCVLVVWSVVLMRCFCGVCWLCWC